MLFSSEEMVLGNQKEVKKNPTAPLRDAKPANSGSDGQKQEQKRGEGGSLWPEVQPAEVRKWIRVTPLPSYRLSPLWHQTRLVEASPFTCLQSDLLLSSHSCIRPCTHLHPHTAPVAKRARILVISSPRKFYFSSPNTTVAVSSVWGLMNSHNSISSTN